MKPFSKLHVVSRRKVREEAEAALAKKEAELVEKAKELETALNMGNILACLGAPACIQGDTSTLLYRGL